MGYVIVTIANLFIRAAAAACFWAWFIVPMSPQNLPLLTIWQVIAIRITYNLFFMIVRTEPASDEAPLDRAFGLMATWLVIWGLGYIVHFWI